MKLYTYFHSFCITTLFAFQSSALPQGGGSSGGKSGFHVDGSKIIDKNGKEFLARGINLQFGDFPDIQIKAFEPIAKTKSNIVRIQIKRDTSTAMLEKAIQETLKFGMVPMLMLWDHATTCADNVNEFKKDYGLWLQPDWIKVIQKNQDQILLNIVNEFSTLKMPREQYRDSYIEAIKKLREAGYTCPLVIDAYHCGQMPDTFTYEGKDDKKQVGKALFEADKLKNLIFSMHLYSWQWSDTKKMAENFELLKKSGFPWIIGEHGNDQLDEKINVEKVYELAKANNVGVIAWSWFGNGDGAKQLDMNHGSEDLKPQDYGRQVISGKNGIQDTSQKVEGLKPK